ncbi:tetratricopeptide repeat protein [Ekhidna sp.]|uniref:tetratricopeptide repeat protein n=1 Tax=Ekhidna sp. TaxID=2608089 RepID=UPI003BAD3D19
MLKSFLIILSLVIISCQPSGNRADTEQTMESASQTKDPSKVYNLMGEELPPPQIPQESKVKLEENLNQARANYEANPDSLELIIWYGRRLAYLGRYLEAIEVFSNGISKFPTSHELRRHRGHRYITTRQLDKAVDDFEMAAFYSVNTENSIEPDGAPNKLNIPLSNDKFNIWYHYGLAHYLNGRFDKALSAYKKCMEFSDNDDLKSATFYWLYMTYKKIGNTSMADDLLADISDEMKIIENDDYLNLLLLFKGEKKIDALMSEAFPEGGNINPTMGYGLGNWYQQQGNLEKANEIFLKILDSPSWASFGYIAAEAELATTFPVPVS